MNFKQDIIQKNTIFFIGFFLFIFIGLATTQYFGRDQLHLLINSSHNFFFDIFFKYISKLSPFILIISILIYVIKKEKYKVLFLLLSSYLLNFIIITFVKTIFFIHVHRPTYYFSQKGIDLHIVDGVKSQIPFTFPSGHTSEAFLLMLFICLIFNLKWVKFTAICMAILIAFSRVYLSKHFLIDTIGGAFLGVFIITLFYYFYKNKSSSLLNKKIIQ